MKLAQDSFYIIRSISQVSVTTKHVKINYDLICSAKDQIIYNKYFILISILRAQDTARFQLLCNSTHN